MNEILEARFVEQIDRLVLGIEPVDAQRRARIAHRIDVALDGVPVLPPGGSMDTGFDPDPVGLLPSLPRRDSGRHALVFTSGCKSRITARSFHPSRRVILFTPPVESPVTIRLFDASRRFVPRRIRYPIPADITVQAPPSRVRRPALFPGAAYAGGPTATGMRGRVTWKQSTVNEEPARWVRVEATINGQVVGRAHGDDRGEFLLMLESQAAGIGDLHSPLVAQVTVFGPPVPPPVVANDPLGDLPIEELLADPDVISPGERLPPHYAATANSTRAVAFELGVLLTHQQKFFFTV
jgi:hypothetical protein